MAGRERAAHQPVGHDRQAAARRRGHELLHARPGSVDPLVERGPRLAVRRRVVERERIERELGVRLATEIAEVALAQERLDGHGRAGRTLHVLGRRHGARVVARDDARDALARQATRQPLGLGQPTRGERNIRMLEDPEGVALGLAVSNQEEPVHRASQTVARTAGSIASTSRRHTRTRAMFSSHFSGTSPRDTWAMNSSRPVAIRSEALTSSCSAWTRPAPGRPYVDTMLPPA